MKPFKKVIAVVIAALIAVSAASCTPISLSKDWAYQYKDENLEQQYDIGMYIYSLYQAYNRAKNYASSVDGYKTSESFMNLEITDDDGNKAVAKDWILDDAEKMMTNLIALDYLCVKDGATLDEAEEKTAKDTAQNAWDLGPYASYGYIQPQKDEVEKYGVSENSYCYASYLASAKQNKLFEKLYAKGGLEEVKDSELVAFVNKNYVSYNSVSLNLYTSETDEDGNSTSKKFSKKKTAAVKEAFEALAEEVSSGSKSYTDAAEELKKKYDLEDSALTTDSVNSKEDLKSSNEDIYKAVKKLDNEKASVITVGDDGDSPMIYLVYKNDIKKASGDYIKDETNRSNVLADMKGDTLKDLLEKTAEELKKSSALTKNDGAIGKYDPDMFFEKVEETTAPADDESDDDSDEEADAE